MVAGAKAGIKQNGKLAISVTPGCCLKKDKKSFTKQRAEKIFVVTSSPLL